MITLNTHLNLLPGTFENNAVITVYFKNRTNIIGTCTIDQTESTTAGTFTVADELHDDLYVLYLYGAIKDDIILEGVLLDDTPHNKSINTLGSIKQG